MFTVMINCNKMYTHSFCSDRQFSVHTHRICFLFLKHTHKAAYLSKDNNSVIYIITFKHLMFYVLVMSQTPTHSLSYVIPLSS